MRKTYSLNSELQGGGGYITSMPALSFPGPFKLFVKKRKRGGTLEERKNARSSVSLHTSHDYALQVLKVVRGNAVKTWLSKT